MTPLVLAILAVTVLATSFISGIFGIAGGMILMGVLLTVLPVATAMILHGVVAAALFAAVRFAPSQAVALIGLGISPFIVLAIPARYVIQAEHRFGSELCGFICTTSQFITGVS